MLTVVAMSCGEDTVVEKIVEIPGDTVKVTPRLDYKLIETFSVDAGDGEDALLASVRGDSVYLYWPLYLQLPDHIAPVIAVSAKATVQPASGAEIPLQTGVTYAVTAEDGSKKVYVLKVVVNQPSAWFEAASAEVEVGTDLTLNGDFFIPDPALTRVFLISEGTDAATEIAISSISETRIKATVPADLAVGAYAVEVRTGWRVAHDRIYDVVDVRYPAPVLDNPVAVTVHQGETIILSGSNLRSIDAARALSVGDGLYYSLEIVEHSLTSITLRVPADFPLGQYNAYQLDCRWAPGGVYVRTLTTSRRLTVEAAPI